MGTRETPLLTDGNGMGMPARNQRQVYTGYVNEQGHGDTEETNPKPPIPVGAFPIGTMNMRFMMVTVLDLIHLYAAFLDRRRKPGSTMAMNINTAKTIKSMGIRNTTVMAAQAG